MRRNDVGLWSPAINAEGRLLAYGTWGRPLLVFPSQQGERWDFENNGMLGAVSGLIDAGRLKVYCVDSFDAGSWMRHDLPLEARAQAHERYEDWILNQVAPWIQAECAGVTEIMVAGCSFGAYHSANLALRHADRFPLALCLSGVYDIVRLGWGETGTSLYFNNPLEYVRNLHGDHLAWLQRQLSLVLVAGQGQWEDTTGALQSTRDFAAVLGEKGIRHQLDIWGHDTPHDWPSWQRQLAHHLPRFC